MVNIIVACRGCSWFWNWLKRWSWRILLLFWRRAYVGLVLAVLLLQRCTDDIGNPLSKKATQGIIQDAKKLPKWKWQSHCGMYLGLSKVYSSNVHPVLNPNTGHISPQYHLVFDNNFSTIYSDGEFDADIWASLISSNLEKHVDADDMLPTFKTETPNTLQLPSIPAVPLLPSLPAIPPPPSIPELPSLPELPSVP